MNDSTEENGKCSEIKQGQRDILLNSIGEICGPWFIMRWIALLPNTVIHMSVKPAGTNSTPVTNSRMVRPRETRAMNIPTNGDHESHHPQYSNVQPPASCST